MLLVLQIMMFAQVIQVEAFSKNMIHRNAASSTGNDAYASNLNKDFYQENYPPEHCSFYR